MSLPSFSQQWGCGPTRAIIPRRLFWGICLPLSSCEMSSLVDFCTSLSTLVSPRFVFIIFKECLLVKRCPVDASSVPPWIDFYTATSRRYSFWLRSVGTARIPAFKILTPLPGRGACGSSSNSLLYSSIIVTITMRS
jgi:hypothetical protein